MKLEANERISKTKFSEEYAKRNGVSIKKANEIVSDFLNTIKDVVKSGRGIQFYGIGNIDVYTLPAGEVRNPLKQEFVKKPERNKVKFKFSEGFKKKVE